MHLECNEDNEINTCLSQLQKHVSSKIWNLYYSGAITLNKKNLDILETMACYCNSNNLMKENQMQYLG